MKLSEAIRDGAKLGPQGFGVGYFHPGTCALGAARELVTGIKHKNNAGACHWAAESFPWTGKTIVKCPACDTQSDICGIVALCLNDKHKWSREAIAEWVEVQENKLEVEEAAKALEPKTSETVKV